MTGNLGARNGKWQATKAGPKPGMLWFIVSALAQRPPELIEFNHDLETTNKTND